MYLKDSPIENQEQDLLHRSNFAKLLGKSLIEANIDESFCVGLFGEWGSGKSSVVNMVREEIEKDLNTKSNKPVVIYFNPWNFSSPSQLLQQYFIVLANKFENSKDEVARGLGKAIRKYGGMLDSVVDIGAIITGGTDVGIAKKCLACVIKVFESCKDSNLTEQKDKVIDILKKQNKKIIIIMDDIDRLSNDEIKLVFKLITSVANFPNTIHVLSFDKEVVVRALNEVQNYDGEKYLEKIIQVPIEIPQISQKYLWDVLFEYLNEMVVNSNIIYEKYYWELVFKECVSKYIRHIRDVKRLNNILRLKCRLIGEEVNFADLVAITVLEIKVPELYRWIKENKSNIFGSWENAILLVNNKPEEIERKNLSKMESINENRAQEYYELIKLLFPSFSRNRQYSYCNVPELLKNKRIGHENVFDRYFVLDLKEDAISRERFNCAINLMNKYELDEYIKEINSKNGIINLLNELNASINDIDKKRVGILVRSLLENAYLFKSNNTNGLVAVSAIGLTLFLLQDLLLRLEEDADKVALLNECIDNCNIENISVVGEFINFIELAHGRLAAKGDARGKKIFSEEYFEDVEKHFIQKIIEIKNINCLFEVAEPKLITYLFSCFDKNGYNEFIKEMLLSPLGMLKVLCLSINKITSSTYVNWEVTNDYQKYFNDKKAIKVFCNCYLNGIIWDLSEEELHQVVAFVLYKEGDVDWNHRVSDDDVVKRIEEMKKCK